MKDNRHIKSLNEHQENFNTSDVSFSDLKKYCDYLIETYKKINSKWGGSGIYWELKQFSEDGRIKDLFEKNDSNKIKIEALNYIRKDIVNFANDWNYTIDVMSFDDFLNI